MAEHTKGPWEAVMHDDPRGQPVPYYRALICTVEHSPDRYLAVVQMNGQHVSREQWQSNARLIAAAPDLLAELKDAVVFMEAVKAQSGDSGVGLLIKSARAALKKATGAE